MIEFRYLHGAVYIFENAKAQRVKVGMTINMLSIGLVMLMTCGWDRRLRARFVEDA